MVYNITRMFPQLLPRAIKTKSTSKTRPPRSVPVRCIIGGVKSRKSPTPSKPEVRPQKKNGDR